GTTPTSPTPAANHATLTTTSIGALSPRGRDASAGAGGRYAAAWLRAGDRGRPPSASSPGGPGAFGGRRRAARAGGTVPAPGCGPASAYRRRRFEPRVRGAPSGGGAAISKVAATRPRPGRPPPPGWRGLRSAPPAPR